MEITDEGSFYRIDGTHFIDKFKIKKMEKHENAIKIEMTDKIVTLEVAQ